MKKEYQIVGGTYFDARTPIEVINVLEKARLNRTRLHISLGDATTGRDWFEEFECFGFVGRSMGPIKVPLILPVRRSIGGGAILDHCIIRIRHSSGQAVRFSGSIPSITTARLRFGRRIRLLFLRTGAH